VTIIFCLISCIRIDWDALTAIRAQAPDLILMDVNLSRPFPRWQKGGAS